jgi:sugar lactone lactonase YvrE
VKTTALTLSLALLAAACGGDAPADPDAAPPADCDLDQPGVICTVVGNGKNGYDIGPDNTELVLEPLAAKLSLPTDTMMAPDGTLYIVDWNNHRIRRIDPADGLLKHVAGRGEPEGAGDDPSNSDLNHPTGVLLSPDGRRLVIAAWHNSQLREVDLATGELVVTCGDGRRAYFGDDDPDGPITLDLPASLVYHPSGDLLIMDQANQVIRRLDQDGVIHRFAGQCVTSEPNVPEPTDVEPSPCPGGSGKFFKGDAAYCARPCNAGYAATDDPLALRMAQEGSQAAFPGGRMVIDPAGNLYFADTNNHLVRRITPAGTVEVVAGLPPVDGVPRSGASPDGTLATAGALNRPTDLALADDGTMYFSDVDNHCIRRIDPVDGALYTVAGACGEPPGFAGDGGPAVAARLSRPYGIELAGDALYVADSGNNRIRLVNLAAP